jgi:signal peptidase I
MTAAGWPLRWQPWPADVAGGWKSSDGGRSFAVSPPAGETHWLRYRHFAPSLFDWQELKRGRVKPGAARPRLITDFYAYDTSIERNAPPGQARVLGLHWVGDLLVECDLESNDGKGAAILDLVKGGRHFRCELDFETGEARLEIDGLEAYRPKAQTAVQGPGTHHLAFANFDRKLVLWVDGSPVEFDAPTTYERLDDDIPRSTAEDPLDLAPAGIASRAASLTASHIRLWRDLYYIADSGSRAGPPSDYAFPESNYAAWLNFLATPEAWAPPGKPSPFNERREAIFPLAEDQFFMLGDNSPMSLDARLWDREKFVSRELLIGRALYIFWPHSFNRVPGTRIPFPFFPNFARMGFIR